MRVGVACELYVRWESPEEAGDAEWEDSQPSEGWRGQLRGTLRILALHGAMVS